MFGQRINKKKNEEFMKRNRGRGRLQVKEKGAKKP
jgi:hypothetical protein